MTIFHRLGLLTLYAFLHLFCNLAEGPPSGAFGLPAGLWLGLLN